MSYIVQLIQIARNKSRIDYKKSKPFLSPREIIRVYSLPNFKCSFLFSSLSKLTEKELANLNISFDDSREINGMFQLYAHNQML